MVLGGNEMKEQFDLLLQYLQGIWLQRRWVVISLWVICPLGWIAVTLMPNQYSAEARVYADTQSILQPLLRGIAIDTDPSQELALMIKTLLSRPNLEKIARYTDADMRASTSQEFGKIVSDLKKNISIKSAGEENLFTINYSGSDPQYTKEVVQAAIDVFIENTVGQKRQDTDKANKFLTSQLKEYETRLIDAEVQLADFKRLNTGYMPGSEQNYYRRLQTLQDQLEDTRLSVLETEIQLATAQKQLSDETAIAAQQMANFSTEYDIRLASLETRLDELLFRFTDKHPDVIETRRQIADLKLLQQGSQKRASSNSPYSNAVLQDIKLNISQLENQLASLKVREANQIEKNNLLAQKLKQVPHVEAQLTNLMRNYDITKSKYEDLLSRREAALISKNVDASSDEINFRVIDPPLAPQSPSGPIRPLLLTVVLIAAIGAGGCIAFVSSQLSPVVVSSVQLYRLTNLPVFGHVSLTESSGLVTKERRKIWLFSFICIVLVVFYVGFIAINSTPSIHSRIIQEIEYL
ncbi:chain-length determining protein [Photobacterium chitinilyticum]|uniref:Chain-length determining protein n=2 Tax=Photobacterium chitinilyticum TaxID=2485123 RepID=A0A3S3S1Z2_9GAMM|nr:chain-length determining protein [Photobacterium chitinilyticum]